MSDQFRDPEAMLARLEEIKNQAESTLAKYDRLQEELGTDSVEAWSEDGLIRVQLDAGGRIEKIDINEAAMRYRQTLAMNIKATVDEAVATYAVKAAEMAQALVGDTMNVMEMVNRHMPEEMRQRARDNLDRPRD